MNFYTSDLHIGHKNVTKQGTNFDNRPFATLDEMHDALKKNWNSQVTNGDHVYILGDCIWTQADENIAFMSTLKGQKTLVFGNHDRNLDRRLIKLFDEIVPYKEIDDVFQGKRHKIVMSHYPIAFWNK